jgi:hypothetical protein
VTAFAADLRGELAVSWKASLFIGNTLAILAASCGRALVILEKLRFSSGTLSPPLRAISLVLVHGSKATIRGCLTLQKSKSR